MNLYTRKFNDLLQANRILSSTLEVSELLRKVMRLATDVVDAQTSSLLLYDENKKELYFDIALSDKESQLKKIRLKLGEGLAGSIAKNRKSEIINDVSRDKRWVKLADDKTSFKTKSVIGVPLVYQGRLLGVIEAINKKKGKFSKEDLNILEAFCGQASVAIENARIFERLQEEKWKIEAMYSQMSDGAIFVDSKGNKIIVNKSAERLLGREQVAKKTLDKIFSGFDIKPSIQEILKSNDKFINVEFSRKRGKSFFLLGITSKILNAVDEVIGLIFIFRDVTAEKRESLVKRNFLSLISHKLKTPLVSIIGYTPLLLKESPLNDFQKKAISSIYKQGNYLSNLVDKLVYFTMVESDNLELIKTCKTFMSIIGTAISNLKNYVDKKSVEIKIDENISGCPKVNLDEDRMEAVVRNLIENAIKFNPKEKKYLRINLKEDNGFVGLEFTDNGPGIPPEERENIFQKFYQIEESFTGQVEGAGLGLALVKRIVEAHGGKVGLESNLGKGSKFHFLIPV